MNSSRVVAADQSLNMIRTALESGKWYQPVNAIRYLSLHCANPEDVLQYAIEQKFFEHFRGEIAYQSDVTISSEVPNRKESGKPDKDFFGNTGTVDDNRLVLG